MLLASWTIGSGTSAWTGGPRRSATSSAAGLPRCGAGFACEPIQLRCTLRQPQHSSTWQGTRRAGLHALPAAPRAHRPPTPTREKLGAMLTFANRRAPISPTHREPGASRRWRRKARAPPPPRIGSRERPGAGGPPKSSPTGANRPTPLRSRRHGCTNPEGPASPRLALARHPSTAPLRRTGLPQAPH